jgi:predicted metalloprotease
MSTSVTCTAPYIDRSTISVSDLENHLNELMHCLMDAWEPVLTDAGYLLPMPSVTVYTAPITTACGELETGNAWYCSGDQQIYYAYDFLSDLPPDLQSAWFMAKALLAHEFGHHVQARTGIFDTGQILANEALTPEEAAVYIRRQELQADCLAGLFINAAGDSIGLTGMDRSTIQALYVHIAYTEEPGFSDHGTGTNRKYWLTNGLDNNALTYCDTYNLSDTDPTIQ